MDSFTKKEQIVILIIVLSIVFMLGFQFIKGSFIKPNNDILLKDDIIEENGLDDSKNIKEKEEESQIIMVHISGEVFNPGLVKLFSGDRIIDAVELAGGLKKEADLDRINLAKKLVDEEKIYIPKIGEEIEAGDLLISSESTITSNNSNQININTCSKSELESLPGIGPAIADRIIEYRKSNSFKSIEDIKNVSGIGDKKYEAIKDLITVTN